MTTLDDTGIVVLIPAKDSATSIETTVTSAIEIAGVQRVLVIDDGSHDDTTTRAISAGARVLRLERNLGKSGAVMAGVGAAPFASIYLMIDADVGASASAAGALLGPVLDGQADMTIGVLPSAGSKGGFGLVRRLAASGIERACGFRPIAPLSGQRAIRGELLRSLELAPRFGLETALTIDAVRAGARVRELPVAMDHRHTGRRWSGFSHRGRQGVDITRALWQRLTSTRLRMAVIAGAIAFAMIWMQWSGGRWVQHGQAISESPSKVVLFGMPSIGLDDIGVGDTPNLDKLISRGALAAMSVRTMSARPSTTEGYASLNAGTRVRASASAGSSAFPADALVENGRAGEAMARRTGRSNDRAEIVVVGYPSIVRQIAGKHLSSEPGALGDAIHAAGKKTAVIGNADSQLSKSAQPPDSFDSSFNMGPTVRDSFEASEVKRPIGVALVDRAGSVDTGNVDGSLLSSDASSPFGLRFNRSKMQSEFASALQRADVIAVDAGDLDRAESYRRLSLDKPGSLQRQNAIKRTDELLGDVMRMTPRDALLMVVSVAPPSPGWHLTPFVMDGPGISKGYASSPSVKRLGVVTVTDIAPTVLTALGADVPTGMIGHPLRHRDAQVNLDYLRNLDRDAEYREGIYFPIALTYIISQALLYLLVMTMVSSFRPRPRTSAVLRSLVTAVAAFPLATFVFRAVPNVAELGDPGIIVLLAITALITALAMRAKRHPLSPLSWVTGLTVALIVVDVATGARLQYSSFLGYSLHTAARFFGIGNTSFATLGACGAIAGSLHVQHAPRRKEALLSIAGLFAVVALADGLPDLGNDVGGILTLVPIFALTLIALSGRRINVRHLIVAGSILLALLGAATAIDLLREPESRTHLGRFAAELFGGDDTAGTTVARKLATNFRVLGSSIWAWMVPISAVFMLYLLVHLNRGAELLPRGSAIRVGVISTIAVGLLGFAVNDSGVVVTALVFVYLGPYLTLLALHHDPAPVLIDTSQAIDST